MSFSGLYLAHCTDATTGRVLIPQVFGKALATLHSWTLPPEAGQDGWVSFVNAEADYPVWLGPVRGPAAEVLPGQKGDKGDQGDPGPPGNVQVTRVETASTLWIVNHNLSRPVAVEVTTLAGAEMDGDVTQTTPNQVRVSFTTPRTGIVIIN